MDRRRWLISCWEAMVAMMVDSGGGEFKLHNNSLHKYSYRISFVRSKQTNTPSLMTKGSELTDVQKGAILALIPHYLYTRIEVQLGIPRSTISSFISCTQKHKSIENLPRPGRP